MFSDKVSYSPNNGRVSEVLGMFSDGLSYSPNKGRVSEVLGMFSESESMKTEKLRRMDIPSEIFSPWSGGERNVTSVSELSIAHGMIRFIV